MSDSKRWISLSNRQAFVEQSRPGDVSNCMTNASFEMKPKQSFLRKGTGLLRYYGTHIPLKPDKSEKTGVKRKHFAARSSPKDKSLSFEQLAELRRQREMKKQMDIELEAKRKEIELEKIYRKYVKLHKKNDGHTSKEPNVKQQMSKSSRISSAEVIKPEMTSLNDMKVNLTERCHASADPEMLENVLIAISQVPDKEDRIAMIEEVLLAEEKLRQQALKNEYMEKLTLATQKTREEIDDELLRLQNSDSVNIEEIRNKEEENDYLRRKYLRFVYQKVLALKRENERLGTQLSDAIMKNKQPLSFSEVSKTVKDILAMNERHSVEFLNSKDGNKDISVRDLSPIKQGNDFSSEQIVEGDVDEDIAHSQQSKEDTSPTTSDYAVNNEINKDAACSWEQSTERKSIIGNNQEAMTAGVAGLFDSNSDFQPDSSYTLTKNTCFRMKIVDGYVVVNWKTFKHHSKQD